MTGATWRHPEAAHLDGCAASASFSPVLLLDATARPVIAHRGDSAHAPENTLVAFAQAVALGVDALEFDCRVSADGVAVVHHDATLDRTTNGSGPLAELTLAQLRRLDAGARFTPDGGRTFPFRGQGVSIPTLDEVLSAFRDVPVLIELKVPDAAAAVRAALDRHGAAGRAVVDSFVGAALDPFRGSPYPVGSTRGDVARLLAATLARRAVRDPGYRVAAVPRWYSGVPLPIGGFVRALRPAGVPVHVWTVDRAEEARALWALGVCGIVSNDPGAILLARDGQPGGATAVRH